ncbi:MAG TPA: hypothetical protein VMU13_01460 [Candidatus Paceibacterota bacterium]|nr:hypothetical protein [Candidatus Paceibacterota bacterium]
MVVQRTIHHLKQRPHHERRAVALLSACFVVVVLFFGWAYAFFASVHSSALANQQAQVAQTAAANDSVQVATPSDTSNFGQTETGQ